MKIIIVIVAVAGLLLTVVPSLLVFSGTLSFEENKFYMIIGAVCWFIAAPFWMRPASK